MKKWLLTILLCILATQYLQAICWEPYCLINDKDPAHRIVFIFAPKNGSTTSRVIMNTLKLSPYHHSQFRDSTKVFIARDPIYRPISIYCEVMKLRFEKNRTVSEEFFKNRDNVAESFKQFLLAIMNDFYEPHISSQHSFLDTKGLNLDDVEFVLLFEKLDEDMQIFCKLNDLTYHDYKDNQSSPHIKKILKELIDSDDEVRDLIYTVWEKDFKFYEEAKKRRDEIFESHLVL